jgi:hypothetical protein
MKAKIALILGLLALLGVAVNEARAVPYDPYGLRAAIVDATADGIRIGFPDDAVDEMVAHTIELKVGKLTGSGTMRITGQDADNQVNFEIRNGTAAGTGSQARFSLVSTDEIELKPTTFTEAFVSFKAPACNAAPPTGACLAREICTDSAGAVHGCPSGGTWP